MLVQTNVRISRRCKECLIRAGNHRMMCSTCRRDERHDDLVLHSLLAGYHERECWESLPYVRLIRRVEARVAERLLRLVAQRLAPPELPARWREACGAA